MPRFFVPSACFSDTPDGRIVTICGEDAHHISHALRMTAGERIVVCPTDGEDCGRVEYACVLHGFTATTVDARIEAVGLCRGEPPYFARLFVALSKADKLETVIQKAVECGVGEIIPFVSARCIVKPGDGETKKQLRRQRIATEAAKQCGRGRIPQVSLPISYVDMLHRAAAADLALFCYEAEQGMTLPEAIARQVKPAQIVSLVVGAEGGFTPEEASAAAEAGLCSVGLGARILRCETAPIFALSCLSYALELSRGEGME